MWIKIAGALAEDGESLEEIVQTVRLAAQAMGMFSIIVFNTPVHGETFEVEFHLEIINFFGYHFL